MKSLNHIILLTLIFGVVFNLEAQNQEHATIYYSSGLNSVGRDIYTMNADGSNSKKLTKKLGSGHYPHNNHPKISPNGLRIAFQSDTDSHDRYTIWTMNIDGSNPTKITQKEGMFPNWSPDGKQLVFSGRRNGIWEILLISSDGGSETIISNNFKNGNRPGWAAVCSIHPNGKSLVYTHIREKVLYNMDLLTKEITQLSPIGAYYLHPIYSEDGLRIAVNRKIDKGYDLITVQPDGKNEKVIAKSVISYASPSWSDSGEEILFTGMINNSQEIFKINIASGQETQLTNNTAFDAMPTWK